MQKIVTLQQLIDACGQFGNVLVLAEDGTVKMVALAGGAYGELTGQKQTRAEVDPERVNKEIIKAQLQETGGDQVIRTGNGQVLVPPRTHVKVEPVGEAEEVLDTTFDFEAPTQNID